MGKKPVQQIVCFCNNVPLDVIQKAIKDGAQTLNEIYDTTTAGIGPCGGSCRRKIAPILEKFLETGEFEESVKVEKVPRQVPKKNPDQT